MLLEHRKDTVREGRQWIVRSTATLSILLIIIVILRDEIPFPMLWMGLLALIWVLFLFYGIASLLKKDKFFCRLDKQCFEQRAPIGAPSFKVPLADITQLECVLSKAEGDSDTWFVHTKTGERLKICANYGNPARKFAKQLRVLCPDLSYVET